MEPRHWPSAPLAEQPLRCTFLGPACLEDSLGIGLCLHCSLARPPVDLNARAPAHNRYMARTCSFEAGSDDDLRGVMNELGVSAITVRQLRISQLRSHRAPNCGELHPHPKSVRARSSCAPSVFKLAIPLAVRGDRRSRQAGAEQAGN